MDTDTVIDLIAAGLPNFIADKNVRETVQSTEELCNEIEKLEHLVKKKTTNTINLKEEELKKVNAGLLTKK